MFCGQRLSLSQNFSPEGWARKKIEEMELVKICRGLEKRGGGQKWIYREEILVAPCRLISHSNAKYLQGEGNFYY